MKTFMHFTATIVLIGFIFQTAWAEHAKDAAEYSIVMMADPQAWRLETGDPNGKTNKTPWEQRNQIVVNTLNALHQQEDIKFGIINGDITEFGRPTTRQSFNEIYDQLKFPFYIGLGNHDYSNNVNDCTIGEWLKFSKNACAWSAVRDMCQRIEKYRKTLDNFSSDIDGSCSFFTGSMAYSFDYGDVHFVQLHNYPTYNVRLDSWDFTFDQKIIKSLSWLDQDLQKAVQRKKHIILNFHDGNDHFRNETTPQDKAYFRSLLETHKVAAVFVGHNHHQSATYNSNDELFGNTPLYVAGALFLGEYYLVKIKKNGLSIIAYSGISGTPKVIKNLPDRSFP